MIVNDKRKDIIMFVFSAIFLSGAVSSIANIVFTEFYDTHKTLFISIIAILALLALVLIFKVMFQYDSSSYKSKIVIAYSMEDKCFVDIPFSPGSVNARVQYNNLPDKHKKKIEKINFKYELIPEDFKEITEFCNCFVVQLIFARILRNARGTNKVDRAYLKEVLVKFKYIDVDEMLGGMESLYSDDNVVLVPTELKLPEEFRIKKVEKNYIQMESKYGFVTFKWSTLQNRFYSKKTQMLSMFEEVDVRKNCQMSIDLEMTYGFKPLKIFKKSTAEFEGFVEKCKNEMQDFDEETSIKKFKISVLPNIISYLDNKFETIAKEEHIV